MKKIALVTGISGQDGAYLAELLVRKNYVVIGADRRSSRDDKWRLRELGIDNKIKIEYFDLAEITQILRLFEKYKFDEVYNLAAQSFVGSSFSNPLTTSDITGIGVLRLLEAIRNSKKKPRFYQASSSEMFGKVLKTPQDINTPFNPVSPYAVSKLYAHFMTRNYREAYNLFAVSGILFNHESPLRGEEFITRKVTIGLSKIKAGLLDCLEVGNIDAKRDWGYAGDYVKAMWLSLQGRSPKDFVLATGKTHSVRDFINESLKYFEIKAYWHGKNENEKLKLKKNNKTIIRINKKFYRPNEVDLLLGNPKQTFKNLKWKPKVNFKELVKIMSLSDLKKYNK
tara:strand:- start:752 stop:1771 length:1020 start_codon:yes stop_codon:yes gene_type:complete